MHVWETCADKAISCRQGGCNTDRVLPHAALIAIVSLIILTAVGTEASAAFSKINSALSSAAS